jgi:Flp pilus assembly protein TadD
MLLLAACGSTPPAPEQAAKADKAAAKQETPADPNAPAVPVEPPVPPEAVQKFEQAVAHMSGDATTAELDMRELADAYPTYSGPLLNLAILQVRSGRLTEAEKSLRSAVDRNGNNAPAFNQLGIVYRKLGRFKEADVAYQRAVEIDPNYAIAYLNLGVLCDLYLQQPQRALEAYERYLALAGAPDEKVSGWVTEIKKRLGGEPRSARAQ